MTQSTAVKTVVRQGNSLAVMISKEAKKMGIREGDKVEVSLSSVDLPQENRFSGIEAIRLLMDGHVLRSADGSIYAMFDPLGISRKEPRKASADVWLAYSDPIDDCTPKLAWTARCNDILALVTCLEWTIEDMKVGDEICLNTKAYFAIIDDARAILTDKGEEITEAAVNSYIRKLNDIGWDYDAKQNKGVYDADRL